VTKLKISLNLIDFSSRLGLQVLGCNFAPYFTGHFLDECLAQELRNRRRETDSFITSLSCSLFIFLAPSS